MARLNIQLPDNLLAAAKRAAHHDELSLSEYIRGLLLYDLNADIAQSSLATGQLQLPVRILPRCRKCSSCDGTGKSGPFSSDCDACDGSGYVVPDEVF